MEIDPVPAPPCDVSPAPSVPPNMRSTSDRFWPSLLSETSRCVRSTTERDVLALPWGPRIDVLFDPKKAPNLLGGTVRLVARTSGTEVEIASSTIASVDKVITLTGAVACDEYVVKAAAGASAANADPMVESYFYARVYANGR